MSSDAHVPVLLGPVLDGLDIKKDGCYVDGTFGRGGHSSAILERLSANGRLLAIDRDPQALASAAAVELSGDPRVTLIRNDFAELATCLGEKGVTGQVDGLLLDLGVSSPQLEEAERGFSFLRDGPLDMRMDPDHGVAAYDWLQSVEESELRNVIYKFGEERHAPRIARAIVAARDSAPVDTTAKLADVVSRALPGQKGGQGRKIHPATKTFQAIRIFINRELEQLEAVLRQSLDVLGSGGRLCVISFHSLEDRITKRFMRDAAREAPQYRGMPDVPAEFRPQLKLIGGAIKASGEEIALNPRSRSARLRVAERL